MNEEQLDSLAPEIPTAMGRSFSSDQLSPEFRKNSEFIHPLRAKSGRHCALRLRILGVIVCEGTHEGSNSQHRFHPAVQLLGEHE